MGKVSSFRHRGLSSDLYLGECFMVKKNISPSVLVVEDDAAISTLLSYTLEKAGYDVRATKDGEEALIMMEERKPDIVLLDWMLPTLTGMQVCERMRRNDETKKIPIIILSAKGEEGDRIEGLERGADDYLVKPFSPKELLARINAVFRRIRPAFVEKELSYGDIKMDLVSRRVWSRDQEISLGPIEYRLLQSFLEYPCRVLSREQLIRRVWKGNSEVDIRTVDVHINRLRKALGNKKNQAIIKTIRAAGYSLKTQEDNKMGLLFVKDNELKDDPNQ